MARIISLVNQKGGVGKTTTAINVAGFLASMGKLTLLIDVDPQGNATSGLGVPTSEGTKGVYEVLAHEASIEEVIHKTEIENLSVIPATEALAGASVELVNVEEREFRLKKALLGIRNNFDYIIMDNPPSLGLITVNSLTASDEVLIPVQAEYYALEGLGQLLNTIELVKQNLNPEIKVLGAVVTMFEKRQRLSRQVLKEMQRHFPYKVFDTIIPRNVKIAESPSFAKPMMQYDPFSKGSRAYQQLAEEIIRTEQSPVV